MSRCVGRRLVCVVGVVLFLILLVSVSFLLGGCCEFAKHAKSGTSAKALICLEKMFRITVTETNASGETVASGSRYMYSSSWAGDAANMSAE